LSRKVVPLLEQLEYTPMDGVEERFRFAKRLPAGTAIVDLLIPKGASRDRPPVLEQGVTTLEAPGLVYALTRGAVDAELRFVDGQTVTDVQVPLPTLDAAFVLKGALMASGVRTRADRVSRDTVDALTLGLACASDDEALGALAEHRSNREARKAIHWIRTSFDEPNSRAGRRVQAYLMEEQGVAQGGEWAVRTAEWIGLRLDEAG
jgi:hypothetical protein